MVGALVRRPGHQERRNRIARLTQDPLVRNIDTRSRWMVREDVVANAGSVTDVTAIGHRLVPERTAGRRVQTEWRFSGRDSADEVGDLLAEITQRHVAGLAVIP